MHTVIQNLEFKIYVK